MGAGNHYVEIQYVSEIYDLDKARILELDQLGTITVMIHCGSRGLGHQIATDYIDKMTSYTLRLKHQNKFTEHTPHFEEDIIPVKDLQLVCSRINSPEGQAYLKAMACAANFAYCNRALLTYFVKRSFEEIFGEDIRVELVYDVSHNMAKWEEHEYIDEETQEKITKKLLVHRKGATRALPPHHPSLPDIYKDIGQPVLVGGSMGTCSYVLVGSNPLTKHLSSAETICSSDATFHSTCHGAGRAQSRAKAKKQINLDTLLENLDSLGIQIGTPNRENLSEEAPESYKDVDDVVNTCESAGFSKKVVQLKPLIVIKG